MTTDKSLRFLLVLALGAACGAPDVGYNATPPPPSNTVVFDPLGGNIPLPNDLAFQPSPTPLPPAQAEFINMLKAQGAAFPNDQDLPVTMTLRSSGGATDGGVATTAPDLDLSTVQSSVVVFRVDTTTGATGTVAIDPPRPTDYVTSTDHGTLSVHRAGRIAWDPGKYIFAMRAGPNGLKTKTGQPVVADPVFFLIAQGQQLNTEQNLGLLRAQTGSTAAAQQTAALLQPLIDNYVKSGVFATVDRAFPHQEAAALTTFSIAAISGSQVQVDPGGGKVPLPFDLLRDPRPVDTTGACTACGKLTSLAACTLAQGTLDAQGVCRDSQGNVDAAATGFAALDGFSTTGAILAPISNGGQAFLVTTDNTTSINTNTVKLYEIPRTGAPTLVNPATYILEPVEFTQSGLSPVIAIQPAGATAGDPSSVARTRPLKDNTDYAVVITDGVKDQAGKALVKGTVASILQFNNPVSVNGKSQLAGIDDATAAALEAMRLKVKAVLAADTADAGHVVMAYTFHTQSILTTGTQLGALPYSIVKAAPAKGKPGAVTPGTAAAAFSKYGVDASVVQNGNIGEVIETTITTFNLIDPTTGAFNASGTTADETINVLIARPSTSGAPYGQLQPCAGAMAPFASLLCSPLVVFRHGLGSGRAAMLTVANTFNAKGYTVVAIDAAKHGDRSFCTSGQNTITIGSTTLPQCGNLLAGGTPPTCTTTLPTGAQGDTNPPGTCGTAGLTYTPVSKACLPVLLGGAGTCGWTGTAGIPTTSSNYLVTANFFRTRDTLRQDIIDESQLVQTIAFVPTGPPPTGNSVFDYMASKGLVIDPTNVSFVGQSLGAIQGTMDVATNPRTSKAVLNVGGATVVDIFTNSPAFAATTNQLIQSLGVLPGTSAYLQFLVVAKTVLDPADPVNYAGHLTANTLPNLLVDQTGATPQAAKSILTQAAFCDQVVPNPFNFILDSTAGSTPMPFDASGNPNPNFGTTAGTFELYWNSSTGGTPNSTKLNACPAPPTNGAATAGAVNHAFFTDWVDTNMTGVAQANAANFLSGIGSPNSVIPVP